MKSFHPRSKIFQPAHCGPRIGSLDPDLLDASMLRPKLMLLVRLLMRLRGLGRLSRRSNESWEDSSRPKEFDGHPVLDSAELAERELEKIRDRTWRYY
jgi:hypothetical protein